MECFKCGVPEDRAFLYEVISPKGIVRVCRKCSHDLDFPMIKTSTDFEEKGDKKRSSVREIMERLSGVKHSPSKQKELEKQDSHLKKIVEENLEEIIKASPISTDEFVDNFHWAIMRARRREKLTQTELARKIHESEIAVKLAEQGIVSEQTPGLVKKLEAYLNVRIKKEMWGPPEKKEIPESTHEFQRPMETATSVKPQIDLGFDPTSSGNVTIGELRAMKEKKEKPLDEQNLDDQEIDDLLFGRK